MLHPLFVFFFSFFFQALYINRFGHVIHAITQAENETKLQTAEERCFLPFGETPSSVAGNLRIIAVGGRGSVALYRPEHEDSKNIIAAPLPASDVT